MIIPTIVTRSIKIEMLGILYVFLWYTIGIPTIQPIFFLIRTKIFLSNISLKHPTKPYFFWLQMSSFLIVRDCQKSHPNRIKPMFSRHFSELKCPSPNFQSAEQTEKHTPSLIFSIDLNIFV